MFQKILLAADGSDHSVRAMEKAVVLAKKIEGASITVIHVVDTIPSRADVLDEQMNPRKDIPEARKAKIAPIESEIRANKISLETIHLFGDPGPAIVREANEGNYDLVVIGSRGLNSFQQFVLGSVSHKVAKRAACPVLIVK
ncbi:Nucleotide-binding universal stress protein, UspA family [Evansella caseinilytica]|uniref:Nucleotide-binding universal stress protein, UspA family n=1 Tax=Evansella caseinilytica TaxID=1503961 RepID=A0A1H3U7A4_9BACI|nr:universal stress protein [Evansella caseinilytica]SDZ58383.1 Nucleotide-binding universal stress protein, UspA family [Evansella caseinilytica]